MCNAYPSPRENSFAKSIFDRLLQRIFLGLIKSLRNYVTLRAFIKSQGHNLYKLKYISLELVKILDYLTENNLFTLSLKIVSSRSKLQFQNI